MPRTPSEPSYDAIEAREALRKLFVNLLRLARAGQGGNWWELPEDLFRAAQMLAIHQTENKKRGMSIDACIAEALTAWHLDYNSKASDAQHAYSSIANGALQYVATSLYGGHPAQMRRAEYEMHDGIRQLEEAHRKLMQKSRSKERDGLKPRDESGER
jgi:hypothetical protein